MTPFDRITRPLEPLDRPVNVLNDLTARFTPWMWWPASPPRRDEPWGVSQHAAYLGWSVATFVAGEALAQQMPEDLRSTGRRLRYERAGTALLSLVLWVLAVGAWDRRAARLRRRPLWRLFLAR